MAHIRRLSLAAIVSSAFVAFVAFGQFIGDALLDVFRADLPPPILDAGSSLHADQVQRTARMEVADSSPAGAMFSETARDHDRYIGDGFTYGGLMLPI